MRFAVLMTCFNRKALTVKCLSGLSASLNELVATPRSADVRLDIWLNDDGSTDGTGEAVQEWFKSITHHFSLFTLHLIKGSGHDYWCGGMRRAWQSAVASGVDYDGYIWLNDDTMLFANALELLLEPKDGIVVGATCNADHSKMTYGGKDVKGYDVVPNGEIQSVEILNGNLVFVPKSAFDVLGIFPDYFTHSIGDYDYGKRARVRGIGIFTTRGYVGVCEEHDKPVPWKDPAQPLVARLKNLYSPLGGAEPPIFFKYNRLHYGLVPAVLRYLKQHAVALMPGRFL